MGKRPGPRRRLGALSGLVAAALILPAGIAGAQERRLGGKLRTGSGVVVGPSEVVRGDLYAFAGNVDVAGRVEGDLVASGGVLTVSGPVSGDVIVAGGNVGISGDVEGDVRAAAGNVTLTGAVGEDFVVTGGQVLLSSRADVAGDFIFGAGDVRMDGSVEGNILGSAGSYRRRGTVGATEEVRVGEGRRQAEPSAAGRVGSALLRYVTIMLVGLLVILVAPRALEAATATARTRPLVVLGIGALAALGLVIGVVVIVAGGVLASVLFGILRLGSLAATLATAGFVAATVVSFAFVVVAVFLADVIVGSAGGRMLLSRDVGRGRTPAIAALALGAAIVVVLTALPVIGALVRVLVALAGVGAVLVAARRPSPSA